MALRTIGNIEGFPILGVGQARWPLKTGVREARESFTLVPSHARSLMQNHGGQPVTLNLTSNDATLSFKGLYAIELRAGQDPAHLQVMLADRRIWWDRKRISADFNIHRNSGTKRTDSTGVVEIDPTLPNVQYAAYSLQDLGAAGGLVKWQADNVLSYVFEELKEIEGHWNGQDWTVITRGLGTGSAVPIDQLFLSDNGRDALARVLAYLPGTDLFLNRDGNVVLFNRRGRGEANQVRNAGGAKAAIHNRGYVGMVDMSWQAPSSVISLFTREFEVRHEVQEAASIGDSVAALGDSRVMTNVVQCPDVTIALTPRGGGASYTAAQGTYADFHQWLTAIDADLQAAPFGDLKRIDYDIIQQAFVPGMGLWNAFQINGLLNPSANWGGRIGAIEDCYRQLWMVNPRWVDRSARIFASSIITLDQALGQRGPARAYCDYATVPSMRGAVKAWVATEKIPFCQNWKCFPLSGRLADGAKISRAEVVMEHEDQGVVRLRWKPNHLGLDDLVLPSMVEIHTLGSTSPVDAAGRPLLPGPDANLALTPDVISMDSSTDENTYTKLTSSYTGCIILIHVPGAPNDTRKLHRVEMSLADLGGILPQSVKDALGSPKGPPYEVAIGSSLETARIPWVDTAEHATLVENSFGMNGGSPPPSSVLDSRVVNLGESATATGASLRAIAAAAAARIYARFTDRILGQMSVALAPAVEPDGSMTEVVHEISARGEGMTTLILPGDLPDIDMLSFLPESARAIVMRLPGVNPVKGK